MKWIAGIDEAGRGPLAGPVVAAAVILDPDRPIEGLDDSKKLSPLRRSELAVIIKSKARDWSIAWANVAEIDRINILEATMLAMERTLNKLKMAPDLVRVDGNRLPRSMPYSAEAVVKGDQLHAEISAASILAKHTRDRIMCRLCRQYPQYGFSKHKGYPTRAHIEALVKYGVSKHHRASFAPVRRILS